MWTKLLEKQRNEYALDVMIKNEKQGCCYHNLDHINAMYTYLENTNEPYNELLDWAVLFHDIVYDKNGNKEKRSAKLFIDFCFLNNLVDLTYVEIVEVSNLILTTIDHRVKDTLSSALIRADLHALTNIDSTIANFLLLKTEAKNLYDTTDVAYARNTVAFMAGLRERVLANSIIDEKHKDFYKDIVKGIDNTIGLSYFYLE